MTLFFMVQKPLQPHSRQQKGEMMRKTMNNANFLKGRFHITFELTSH
jgi:hypothetical protein